MLLLSLNILLINHLLLPFNVLPISHLLLSLYPKTPRSRSKARWSKTNWKRIRSMLHLTRTTQSRKRGVSRKNKTKQRRKNQCDRGIEMGGYRKSRDKKRMYFRGRDTRWSWPLLNTLWHISNGYRNEWTSRNQCDRKDKVSIWNNGRWNEGIPCVKIFYGYQ